MHYTVGQRPRRTYENLDASKSSALMTTLGDKTHRALAMFSPLMFGRRSVKPFPLAGSVPGPKGLLQSDHIQCHSCFRSTPRERRVHLCEMGLLPPACRETQSCSELELVWRVT